MKKMTTKKLTSLALFTALAVVFSFLLRIPLVPSVSFLTYDPKDIVLALAGFLFGPYSALAVTGMASLLENLFTGGSIVDIVMNFISSATFVCTASFVYRKMHTKNGAVIGLLAGTAVNVIAMLVWNYIVDPFYFGVDQSVVNAMLPAIGLFNVLKQGINSGILLLVYKPIVTALRKSGLVPASGAHDQGRTVYATAAGFVLVTAVIAVVCFLY
jgi:riboflavin transporter FmnP